MGESSKYYNAEEYISGKKNQGKNVRNPPGANFLAAANHIRKFFDGKNFNWAAFGGLAIHCLGSRREIADIHIVYDDRDFHRIQTKLEADSRMRLPQGMNALFPSKLLLSTGPKYKDAGCTENMDIEVNIVPPGSYGTPPNDVLRNHQALQRLDTNGKIKNIRILDILYLVKTSLALYKNQELNWDPRKDILFLCQNFGKETASIRNHLDPRQMHESFLGTSYFAKLPLDDQRRCYHVLVGQEPPPTMELTTPPPGSRTLNTAAVRVARPRISTHVSSPALHTAMQQTPAYLGPLRSEQPNSSLHPTGPHVLQAHAVPIYSSVGRDGHPRYRPVSAPNAPSANQNPSPKTNVTNGSRPDLVQPQAPQQQTHKPVYVAARVVEVKTVHNRVQTQMVSSHSSGPSMGNPPRKPMPNSNVGYMVHGQSSAPAPLGAPFQVQTAAPVRSATAVATTGVRSSHNPIPQKSQQGAHNAPSHVSSSNIGPRPVEPYRISQATSAGVRPQARASSHTHQHISNSVDTHASAQPQYNNVEHSRHTSPGLKLVGPQGVYTSPPKPAQPIQSAPHIPPTQTYQSSSHPAQPFTHQTQQLPTRSLNEDAASQAHLQQPVAPLPVGNPQARAAPPQGLPASLMIGGSRPQRHSTSQPRQVNGVPMLLTSHQGYYSPPSSAPNSTHPSPQAKPASVAGYKAYSVPISPPMPPATAPAKLQHPPPMLHMEAAMAPAQHVTSQYGVPSVPVAARQTSPARDPHAYHVNTSSSVLPTPAYNHHTSHTETTMTAGATMVTAAAIPTAGYGAHFYTTNEQTTTHIHHENYANHPHHMPSELPASTPTPPLLQLQSPFLRDAALAIAETPSSAYQTPIDWQQVPAPLQTKLRLSIQPQLSVQTHQHNDNQAAAPADSPSASDDFTPTHQRNISLESHSSEELAAEYRLELPDSGDMFKSPIELVEGGAELGGGNGGSGSESGSEQVVLGKWGVEADYEGDGYEEYDW